MQKVFISGSISIKELPTKVKNRLDNMINKLHILVGDADGIDSTVQNYFKHKNYFNVTVYSIYEKPRSIKSDKFTIKTIAVEGSTTKERERQAEKDKAMTDDSNYSLVIWDGNSLGSFNNIIRSIEQKKPAVVFYTKIDDFLPPNKLTSPEIEYIYYESNGYTGSEVIDKLGSEIPFNTTKELKKYLRDNKIIERKDDLDYPCKGFEDLFILEKYRGKITNLKFSIKFTEWITQQSIKNEMVDTQESLF